MKIIAAYITDQNKRLVCREWLCLRLSSVKFLLTIGIVIACIEGINITTQGKNIEDIYY